MSAVRLCSPPERSAQLRRRNMRMHRNAAALVLDITAQPAVSGHAVRYGLNDRHKCGSGDSTERNRQMASIHVLAVALFVVAVDGTEAQNKFHTASLTVSAITRKREYIVGEEWVYTFKATATASQDKPLKVRAWSRFFAAYDVIPEYHGPLTDSTLSDVLATGVHIWRDGLPVVLWNAPDSSVFTKTPQMTIAAGQTASATFKHNFGAGLKPGNFQYKLWFASVVEPSPEKHMLLFLP